MKTFFKILATLFAVIILVTVGALFLIPKDKIKSQIQTAVYNQTGRNLNFDDEIGFSFYPNLGVELHNVTFTNADWADEDMVRIGEMDVALALMPLFDKKVEVKRFILNQPMIRLQKNAQGASNWEFQAPTEQKSAENTTRPANDNSSAGQDLDVSFSTFVINGGTLVYADAASGLKETIKNIDVTLEMPNLKSSLDFNGGMTVRGEDAEIKAHLESLEALRNGQTTPANITAEIAGTEISFNGQYTPDQKSYATGKIEVSVNDLERLLKLAGQREAGAEYPITAFNATLNGTAGPAEVTYDKIALDADGLSVTGQGRVAYGGDRPFIGGRYQVGMLDLNQFINKESRNAATPKKEGNTGASQNASAPGWDNTPIDLSFFNTVNADITANVEGYKYDGLNIGGNTLQVEINQGQVKLNVSETAVFDGTITETLTINAASKSPVIRSNAKVRGMQAKPLLSYLAAYENLSGRMDGTFNVTMTGPSLRDMMHSLNGTVDVSFKDGEITGVSLVDWAKAFQQRLASVKEEYGSTRFVETGGRMDINNGIGRNYDFRLDGPLVEATGQGTVNIKDKQMDYRLTTTLLPEAKAEKSLKAGIDMPFIIKGPWSNLKVRPDIQGVVSNILKDPKSAEQTLKNMKEAGKTLEDSFDGQKDKIKEDVDKLKKIFDKF